MSREPGMTFPGALICEMAQIHKRQVGDILLFSIRPAGLKLNTEGCVCLLGES